MNLTGALSCIIAATWLLCKQCETAPEMVDGAHRRLRNRPILRGYAIDEFIEEEDDDLLESNKRQQFDDYGHMRFGKRGKYDDYGHMRFGRHHE